MPTWSRPCGYAAICRCIEAGEAGSGCDSMTGIYDYIFNLAYTLFVLKYVFILNRVLVDIACNYKYLCNEWLNRSRGYNSI